MGKIDEFERKIIDQGMTDEDFLEYEKMLKKVRDNFSKRQRCYTTAIQLPEKYSEQAVKLIQYGLDNFEDGWFSTYTSYLYMGHIYDRIRNYQKAYESYLLAKEALGMDHLEYVEELSKDLMWTKLHIDSFKYSAELEDYLSQYQKTSDFSKAFINTEFKIAVANIVIALHYERYDEAKKFLERAKGICNPNYVGKLYDILARHKHKETLTTTPESILFLKQLKDK